MNYRHAYHAGNFADVVKHIVLALVVERLKAKEAPFRVIDTHAGVGCYELGAEAATRTGEWRDGIGRLLGRHAEPLPAALAATLAPYLDAVRSVNVPGELTRYPGSPMIARALLRPQDQLIVNELHAEDAAQLRDLFARDRQTKVMTLDGWVALKALLPPRERRGVVLIDPPFEEGGELERLLLALTEARKRFATGVYLLWYPIKDTKPIARFHDSIGNLGVVKALAIDHFIRAPRDPERLNGAGLVVVNPPYQLEATLAHVLPMLAQRLGQGAGACWRMTWLAGGA